MCSAAATCTECRLAQVPRGDAAETLARLRAQGLALEISSGDGEDAVREVARQFKVARWSARQSPALKLERMRALQQVWVERAVI